MQYRSLGDLPEDIQQLLRTRNPSNPSYGLDNPVPALGGKSIMELMNGTEGHRRVTEFLEKVIGYGY
jgi:hypothetical protein